MANLKITLVKSTIGAVPKHRRTVEALGLKKVNKTVVLPDNAATRGMVQQVRHLVKVSEEVVDTAQEMVRLLVRDTKVRKLVPELRDQVSKVDRCHYTDVFLREVSLAETLRKSLESMSVLLKYLTTMQ